jgi:aspartyl-tRNA(Asn)/glutamyl-tRNA(Gln) amidotransferase subunit B
VARFRAGEDKVTGFLVGQVMRATQGKADPKLVNQLLAEKLSP